MYHSFLLHPSTAEIKRTILRHAQLPAVAGVLVSCTYSLRLSWQLSALLGKESVRVLRQSGGSLDMAAGGAGGDEAGKKPVDSVTLGRTGLSGDEEAARVMPVLRLAVVKDDQVRVVGGCV